MTRRRTYGFDSEKAKRISLKTEQAYLENQTPIMKVYVIWYAAPAHINVDDTYIALSKADAARKFIIDTKGKYLVLKVTEK